MGITNNLDSTRTFTFTYDQLNSINTAATSSASAAYKEEIKGEIGRSPSFEANIILDGGPTQNIPISDSTTNFWAFPANLILWPEKSIDLNVTLEPPKEQK